MFDDMVPTVRGVADTCGGFQWWVQMLWMTRYT
jgi:hypothetical protein